MVNYSNQIFKILCLTAIVGDITPSDGIPKAEKSRREQAALDEMCEVLGGGPIGGCTFFMLNVRSCSNFQHQKTNYLSIIFLFCS